jgi:uncharacterized protein YdeI (YjbR/CyaY-like superfamily)
MKTLQLESPQAWRAWLEEHHDSEAEVWLVFLKRHADHSAISYEDEINQALCFGWVDSLVKRLDEDRYALKFTPRKTSSKWSASNRRRFAALKSQGLLAAAGLNRSPTGRSGDAPRSAVSEMPAYIRSALRANARAWNHFQKLAPSCQRAYLGRVDSAKKTVTKEKRLRELISTLAAGKKLGLK